MLNRSGGSSSVEESGEVKVRNWAAILIIVFMTIMLVVLER